ncbi:MAG: RnfABCDGE type electron transport complex subunit D [Steroidobacteraceae bacterium]|nr:RnfABCDGE type electron transport complex subunit D [Steroidobacteraceae bacterium]
MAVTTNPPPHVVAGYTVPRVMMQVLLALVPVVCVQVYLFGPRPLVLLAVASLAALCCEALALALRRRDLRPTLRDGSVLVTAALLALAVPPTLPFWLVVFGVALAVLLAKHAYGGLGQNPFNPAMVGYAVLLVSFPLEMTRWPEPGAGWEAMTGATALDTLRTGLRQSYTMQEIFSGAAFGHVGAAAGEWVNVAALAGGLYLLARRIIRWHIPVAMLAGLAVPAALFNLFDPGAHASAAFHLAAGATMLGAFFIATDPVSAATSDRGRLLYGAGIGVLTWVIRTWGGFPDGVAFAVLIMNLAVPLIDRYTVPRIYGH